MSIFFTSDTHFGKDAEDIIERENRPFQNAVDYLEKQFELWNCSTCSNDVIYHVGDFFNYNGNENEWMYACNYLKTLKANIIMIVGNNEDRIIETSFHSSFDEFRTFCIQYGFQDVKKEYYLTMRGEKFYLNHYPHNHKEGYINLFGHTHRSTGIWKPFGLNVGTDLNHFRLYSENDIFFLLSQKDQWWDKDIDNLCM